jgi:hypothetical protein
VHCKCRRGQYVSTARRRSGDRLVDTVTSNGARDVKVPLDKPGKKYTASVY